MPADPNAQLAVWVRVGAKNVYGPWGKLCVGNLAASLCDRAREWIEAHRKRGQTWSVCVTKNGERPYNGPGAG
jgi:hypothetical protein